MALRTEPWLVYSHGKKKRSQTFYSLSDRRYHIKHIPEMQNSIIYAHSHGWLVLIHQSEDKCSLYNPVTTEKIKLPELPREYFNKGLSNCIVSSDPGAVDRSSCIVMIMGETNSSGTKLKWFLFCKPGDVEWTEQKLPAPCICEERDVAYVDAIASLDGEFYILTGCCYCLFKVQFNQSVDNDDKNELRLLDLHFSRPERPHRHYNRCGAESNQFLVRSWQPSELMVVEVDYADKIPDEDDRIKDIGLKGVELYKANFTEEKWECLGDLPDDCAVFLGPQRDNIVFYDNIPREYLDAGLFRGNTVYIMQQDKDCSHLYVYDVREKSISLCRLHCPNVKRDCSEPQWILHPCSQDRGGTFSSGGGKEIASKQEMMSPAGSSNVGNPWCDVPFELLSDIQSRLFGADRCYFQLACKTWQSAFSASGSVHQMENHRFPILIHIGNDGEFVNFFNPITISTSTLPLPGLKGAVIHSSRHGWLLLSQGSIGGKIFFFNPFTSERIDLPNLGEQHGFEGITFSSPPTSSDCMVLGYSVTSTFVRLRSIYRGEHRWTNSLVETYGVRFENSFNNPVYHQRLFYFMGKTGNLCIHDPKARTEPSTTRLLKLPSKPCTSIRGSHLLECNGKLLSVFTGLAGRFLLIYELNEGTMTWEEVESLEDKMLFLSFTSSLSTTSSGLGISGLGNKVFLDRFNAKDDGVFYSLATRRFHTFWSGYNSDDWCDTKEYLNCAWIEPNFEMHTEAELRWFDPVDDDLEQ